MHGKEGVTDINYSTDVRTTERWIADAGPQNISESQIHGGYLCSDLFLLIFSLLMTQQGSLGRPITLKHGKTLRTRIDNGSNSV